MRGMCNDVYVNFFLIFFIKAYVVVIHLNCKFRQCKWVPTTFAFIKNWIKYKDSNQELLDSALIAVSVVNIMNMVIISTLVHSISSSKLIRLTKTLSSWKHVYSNILKISSPKTESFLIKKNDIFHISAQNIDFGYSLECLMFSSRNKENMYTLPTPVLLYKSGV